VGGFAGSRAQPARQAKRRWAVGIEIGIGIGFGFEWHSVKAVFEWMMTQQVMIAVGSDGAAGIAPRSPSTPPDMRFSASGG
jgi:hypothetical protein